MIDIPSGTVFITTELNDKFEANKDTLGYYDRKSLSQLNDGINLHNLRHAILPENSKISKKIELSLADLSNEYSGIIFEGAPGLNPGYSNSIHFWSSRYERSQKFLNKILGNKNKHSRYNLEDLIENDEDKKELLDLTDSGTYSFDSSYFPFFKEDYGLLEPINKNQPETPFILTEFVALKIDPSIIKDITDQNSFIQFSMKRNNANESFPAGSIDEQYTKKEFPDNKEDYESKFYLKVSDIEICPKNTIDNLIYMDAFVFDLFDYGYYV